MEHTKLYILCLLLADPDSEELRFPVSTSMDALPPRHELCSENTTDVRYGLCSAPLPIRQAYKKDGRESLDQEIQFKCKLRCSTQR